MTFRDAIATFRARAAAGEIVNRKTGKRGPFATTRVAPILSNVWSAVGQAALSVHGRALSETELLDVNLEPLWTSLPHHAFVAAAERSDPTKERSNVRLFVSAVTGIDIERAPQPVRVTRVPGRWQFLYEAVEAAAAKPDGDPGALDPATGRAYKRGVLKMAELALANGCPGPDELPNDGAEIESWGNALGWPAKDVAYCLTAYRRAADLAGANHLPRAYEVVQPGAMGIKGLEDYPQRLRAAGFAGDARTIAPLEAVTLLAPDLGDGLDKVVTEGRARGLSVGWVDSRADMASWVVATLVRHADTIPVDLATLTWLDLWLERRPVAVEIHAAQAKQHSRYLKRNPDSKQGAEMRSLMRLVLDASAARSYENSPLTLANPAYERDPVPVYTQKLQQHAEAAWMVTYEFFGGEMQAHNPELWAQARNEYEALLKHIDAYNTPRVLKGRKPKSRLPITWPQMMCMGVPYLARAAYEIRSKMQERLFNAGNLYSRNSQQLLNRYCDALRDWAVVVLLTDDGLRIKNYCGAAAGWQVVPTWRRTTSGEIVGISKLTTRWSGLDPEHVRPKVWRRGQEVPEREREVTPAFLDPVLLWDYWTLARPRALVAAGLLATVDEYSVGDDAWPVFITPRPSAAQLVTYRGQRAAYEEALLRIAEGDDSSQPERPVWQGNLSEDMLSATFGSAMHRVCVEVLGRDLPPYDSTELTAEWRSIFAAHITRTWIACYHGGVRRNWELAMHLTEDSEATLRKDYYRLQASFDAMKSRRDWENPTWFDRVIDRALERHPDDDWQRFWATFDPMRPEDALRRLDAPQRDRRQRRVPAQR